MAVLLAGCATARPDPRLTMRYEKGIDVMDLDSLVQRAGAGPVSVIDLGRTAWVSHHVAFVREGEEPHYHRFHDLTVVVLRGEGTMDMEGKRFAMKPGDVIQIPRNVRHHFLNTGQDIAAAFVIFSPPFDGRDTVTADVPEQATPEPTPPPKQESPAGRDSLRP